MRVVIADDEPLALELVERSLAGREGVEIVGRARSGDEAAAAIMTHRPDLAILDIAMPKLTGLDVARLASQTPQPPLFAFLTAYSDFAVKAFELDAIDYVLKPFTIERLGETVQRATRRLAMGAAPVDVLAMTAPDPGAGEDGGFDRELWVPTRLGARRLATRDIIWIEAARDYVLLHTAMRTEIMRARMADLQERLDPAELLRVHRSYFVRPEAVVELEQIGRSQLALVLDTGARVEVGRTYADQVRLALSVQGLRGRRGA
ncbi:MAG: response regulator [Caulobacter sp.]|nr:response regulator [Caulobacter sp.]